MERWACCFRLLFYAWTMFCLCNSFHLSDFIANDILSRADICHTTASAMLKLMSDNERKPQFHFSTFHGWQATQSHLGFWNPATIIFLVVFLIRFRSVGGVSSSSTFFSSLACLKQTEQYADDEREKKIGDRFNFQFSIFLFRFGCGSEKGNAICMALEFQSSCQLKLIWCS